MYYRGAQAAIVVYDIQNQDSFHRAKAWVKELHKQVRKCVFLFEENQIIYQTLLLVFAKYLYNVI